MRAADELVEGVGDGRDGSGRPGGVGRQRGQGGRSRAVVRRRVNGAWGPGRSRVGGAAGRVLGGGGDSGACHDGDSVPVLRRYSVFDFVCADVFWTTIALVSGVKSSGSATILDAVSVPPLRISQDAISPVPRQSKPFRLEIAEFSRQFPRYSSLTAPELIAARPRAFPAAPAAFPRPPSPPASLLARVTSSGRTPPRAGRLGPAGTDQEGREPELNGYKATDGRQGIDGRHTCPARHLRLFYRLDLYIGLGVHWKVYSRHVLRIRRRQGAPLSAGTRISWQVS
jgi:hypothetical protein